MAWESRAPLLTKLTMRRNEIGDITVLSRTTG